MSTACAFVAACVAMVPLVAPAAATWDGSGADSNWFNPTNWAGDVLPGATDDVFVVSGAGGPVLTGSVAVLTLTLSNKTLTFQGTNTVLTASNVVVGSGGTMTHGANPDPDSPWVLSHRVVLVCTNLTVESGGSIDANSKGYAGGVYGGVSNGCGPGGGTWGGSAHPYGGGGGHGGDGGYGNVATATGGVTYGSADAPSDAGSGGAAGSGPGANGGAGGGAVRISAAGKVTVNGAITATGQAPIDSGNYAGGGSGGSVYITCETFAGSNGMISVNGGLGYYNGGGGGGGRISVIFNQALAPTVAFGASGGIGGSYGAKEGRPGTLYLSQYEGVLLTSWSNGLALASSNHWSPATLTLSSTGTVAVFRPGFQLNVAGPVQVLGGAALEIGSNATLRCAGLFLTNSGSTLILYTNAAADVGHGNAELAVGSVLKMYPGTLVTNAATISVMGTASLYCHPTSGVPPMGFVASNFFIGAGGAVNADYAGYAGGGYGAMTNGWGPGGGTWWGGSGYGGGGGHGGDGGYGNSAAATGGVTYGSTDAPTQAGSGGARGSAAGSLGGAGGGAVRINAAGTVTIDGSMTANGQAAIDGGNYAGGGSGGSVYITCDTFTGSNGSISVNGGLAYYSGGGGGGGRISVIFNQALAPTVKFGASGGIGGTGGGAGKNGRPGTLYLSQCDGVLPTLWTNGLVLASSTNWSPASFTLSNATTVAVFSPEFQLNVAGPVWVFAGATLEIWSNATLRCSSLFLTNSGSTLILSTNAAADIGHGNADLAGGSVLKMYPAASLFNVATMSVMGTAYLYCHPGSGVAPAELMAENFFVAAGGAMNADYGGYAGGGFGGISNGWGPGGGTWGTTHAGGGGGHGGAGGSGVSGATGGGTYGTSSLPTQAGSGGANGTYAGAPGGAGGGVVRMNAAGTVTVNGAITANGQPAPNGAVWSGGGAGGSIYIRCNLIDGATGGVIRANGGAAYNSGGGGGGGRIAVRCLYNHYSGTTSVTNGTGPYPGQAGTIYWRVQGPGTVFSVR